MADTDLLRLHQAAPPRCAKPTPRAAAAAGRPRALLTAAARGIGFASAVRLAAEGARSGSPTATRRRWPGRGGAAARAGLALQARRLDSADTAHVAHTHRPWWPRPGRFDILVNNAGGSLHTPFRLLDETTRTGSACCSST
jgi:NAD(P)-dependent dehydrogenase (short-subunit alcohol dehydrogenase family)